MQGESARRILSKESGQTGLPEIQRIKIGFVFFFFFEIPGRTRLDTSENDKKNTKWFNYANMPKRHLVKCGRCLTFDGRRVGHSGMVLEVLRANKKAISSSSRFFYNKHLDGCLISTLLSFIYWQFQVQRLL